jgi:glyoxylase-like metal-dependent hydrolase (beta-lactamase superfamily II)
MRKASQLKHIIPLFLIIICFCFAMAAPANAGLTKIAEGVFSYVDDKDPSPATSFGANAGIVIGKDGIVVIDTLISAKKAQQFIKDIRAISDKPIRYVVNTHDHLDHVLGNSEFAKIGAVIIAHTDAKAAMVKNGDGMLQYAKKTGLSDEAMSGTTVVVPSLTFSDAMQIDLGDRKVELMNASPSHSAGSIIVYVPDSKALFAGDILFTDYHPYMGDGDIIGWIKALEKIALMDIVSVIPGHGPISSKKDIEDLKKYIIAFDAKAKELTAKSNDLAYIAAEVKKAIPQRKYFDNFVAFNVKKLYLKK